MTFVTVYAVLSSQKKLKQIWHKPSPLI